MPFRVFGGDTLGDTFGVTRTIDYRSELSARSLSLRIRFALRAGKPRAVHRVPDGPQQPVLWQ